MVQHFVTQRDNTVSKAQRFLDAIVTWSSFLNSSHLARWFESQSEFSSGVSSGPLQQWGGFGMDLPLKQWGGFGSTYPFIE
jgi:hypothetical protein